MIAYRLYPFVDRLVLLWLIDKIGISKIVADVILYNLYSINYEICEIGWGHLSDPYDMGHIRPKASLVLGKNSQKKYFQGRRARFAD